MTDINKYPNKIEGELANRKWSSYFRNSLITEAIAI